MENKNIPRLCGGTFFVLLLQAKKQRTSARMKITGDVDGLSDSDMLKGLIRVAAPTYKDPNKDSFKTNTSNYKSCRISYGAYLPFKKEEFVTAFENTIKNNYAQALSLMSNFLDTFVDINQASNKLVMALLELIESDDSILNNDKFYIENENPPITKCELIEMAEVSLAPFLLGIWHFIIINRPNNKVGRSTYENWHNKSNLIGKKSEFTSNIGKESGRTICVKVAEFSSPELKIPPRNMQNLMSEFVPELNRKTPCVNNSKEILFSKYSKYLENAKEKYSHIKTLLFSDQPRNFYDFYVCNDIYQKIYISKNTYKSKVIRNATTALLSACSNFIIISGTGGLGKSMMMRHLLLDSINNFQFTGMIPIFIPLKDYNTLYENLTEYIFEKFNDLGGGKDPSEFEKLLLAGNCILLFDGLDEISSTCRKQFERSLETFADKHSKNMFVMSSRPYGSFVSFNRFTVLNLQAFTKDQALLLVEKLDFRPDEPAIKAKFRKELESSLYYSHREFIQNPLLLSIMLMTYEQFAEVPSKMHIFYHEAYLALSQKHDASKGAYKRVLKTGLAADKFADYFAEFCARTYRDEKFELTEIEFEKYFNQLKDHQKDNCITAVSDFIYDLTANMCLMYYESSKYHFTHRSFQEYFCALFFSKQKDKTLQKIGNFFDNKRGRNYGDKTFNMLYDMIPDKIEEYIFTPFLSSLFESCNDENGYWTFLKKMYPTIYYESGEVNEFCQNEPTSFLYNFIINEKCLYETIDSESFPFYKEFVIAEYVYIIEDWRIQDEYSGLELTNKDDVDAEYFYMYGEPEIEGWNLEFNIEKILRQPEKYFELINILNNYNFALKREYQSVQAYLRELIREQSTTGSDLFDLF